MKILPGNMNIFFSMRLLLFCCLLWLEFSKGVNAMPEKTQNFDVYLSDKDPSTTKKIEFKGNKNPTGTIPSEIGAFTALTEMNIGNGEMKGKIPPEIGKLRNLESLVLSLNSLTGSVPREIGDLTSLKMLHLDNLLLTKSIPTEMGRLTGLTELFLHSNKLTGAIPSELGKLLSINHLRVDRTDLTGMIPRELEQLQELNIYEFPPSVCAISPTRFVKDVTECSKTQAPSTITPTRKPTNFPTPEPTPNPSRKPINLPTPTTTSSPTIKFKSSRASETATAINMGAVIVLATFVGVLMIISCIVLICYRRRSVNTVDADDNARGGTAVSMKAIFSFLSVTLGVFDMTTDFMYAASLFSNGKSIPGTAVLIFVFLPLLCNLMAILWFQHRKMKNARNSGDRAYKRWIEQNEVLSVVITFLSSISTELLALASIGCWRLNLPLSILDIYQLRTLGIITSVLEDIPQMVIVIMTQGSGNWSIIAIVTLATSVVSFVFTVIFRLQSCILWLNADVDYRDGVEDIEEKGNMQWVKRDSGERPEVKSDKIFDSSVSMNGKNSSSNEGEEEAGKPTKYSNNSLTAS
mmetsp:Transcript_22539/g.28780  ORF Transcript_22539/g.28780 Transcript_22539/m.28780 type:complete len:579 (+) Transcript_22539:145-1881(+)